MRESDVWRTSPYFWQAVLSGCQLKRNAADDTKDKLLWKWIKGQATSQEEFGDPVHATDYALCIYTGTASTLLAEVDVPDDSTKWSAVSTKGFNYKDPAATEDGVQKIVLKGSTEDKAKALVKGKDANLPDPALGSIPPPVTVQLVNSGTPVCWEAAYDAGDIIKNESDQLKAKKNRVGCATDLRGCTDPLTLREPRGGFASA